MPDKTSKPEARRPREIKGNFYEVMHALRKLGSISLTTAALENIDLDAPFSASAFSWEVTPTRYELSSGGIHLGVAYIK
jgi:hypothetical protein